jgi:hypothetical protein
VSLTTLLLSDAARDEAVLETDIMRFMAVIGIVLWIIFALVKSLPFRQEAPTIAAAPRIESVTQHPESTPTPRPAPAVSPSAPSRQEQPTPRPRLPQRPIQAGPATEPPQAETLSPRPEPASPRPVQPETPPAPARHATARGPEPTQALHEPDPGTPDLEQPEPGEPSLERSVDQFVAAAPQGVWIEFASREELSALLARGQVRIFAQARTAGFDLLYEAQAGGGALRFNSAQNLPESLWVISGGQDRDYFIGLLSRNEPSLAAFPDQDILVAFTDQTLEDRLLDQFDFLGKSGRSGVLSITGNGEFVFRDHQQQSSTIPGTQEREVL